MSFVLLASCDPKVLDNERWVVEGKVTDSSGNPLEDIRISTKVYQYHLGEGRSDENGDFNFITLGTDQNYFEIFINSDPKHQDDEIHEEWSSAHFYFEDRDQFKPNFVLGDVQLKRTARLHLKIEGNQSSSGNLKFSLKYPSTYYYEHIDLNTNPQEGYNNLEIFSQNISSQEDYEKDFRSLLNSNVILTYSINDGEQTQITIPLTEIENTYVLQL